MQVQIEDAGPCKKLLKLEVSEEDVRKEVEKNYDELNKTLTLPGFRRGHVPRGLLEKRFGEQVSDDARDALLAKTLEEALKEQNIEMVGQPEFKKDEAGKIPFDPKQGLKFEVTVETKPVFEVPTYAGMNLKKKKVVVGDDEINKTVEELRQRTAKLVAVEGGVVEEKDVVMADVVITAEGQELLRREDASVPTTGKMIYGIPVENLLDVLKGAKAGEQRELTAAIPDTFSKEELRGKQATMQFAVKDVKRIELPTIDEEWAKRMGFETLAEVREMIQKDLTKQKEEEVKADLVEQVRNDLMGKVEFPLPQGLIDAQTEHLIRRRKLSLLYSGVAEDKLDEEVDKFKEQYKEDAVKVCKNFFILDAISRRERVFATETEVEQRLQAMAARANRPYKEIKEKMEADGTADDVRMDIREGKTIDLIIEKANIAEVGPEEPAPQEKPNE